jgi:hypothetical protein
MRKLVWGGIVACFLIGGLGVYLAMNSRSPVPAPVSVDVEEQEAPPTVPFAVGELVHHEPAQNEPMKVERISVAIGEPIVVEGLPAEPPPPPAFGGEPVAPSNVYLIAPGAEPPPRPDEEPGEEKKMPYVADVKAAEAVATQLVESLWRMLTGAPAETTATESTPPETVEPPLPPVVDYRYHDHEMCCPYTGRCVRPYYPVPPPAAPENK